jgi:hypothetical protein
LSFNPSPDFVSVPSQGVTYSNLICYWNLNGGLGNVAYDSSGNGNNGVIYGASWVAGKYGGALSFNGTSDYAETNASLNVGNSFTLAAWIKRSSTDAVFGYVLANGNSGASSNKFAFYARGDYNWKLAFESGDGNSSDLEIGNISVPQDVWTHIAVTINGANGVFYLNGQIDGTFTLNHADFSKNAQIEMGRSANNYADCFFGGVIDDIQIYNRTLSANELAQLYAMGPLPDPTSFTNYYNFKDALTNNTMLVNVNNPNGNTNNVALVTCSHFFADNALTFQANNSATVNVWSTFGQPMFTTGVWNRNNYTCTLTLDGSSTGELNWNTYNITTYTDAHSSVSPANVTVPYEGSQQFSMTAGSGYYISHVYEDGVDQGNLTTYSFTNVQDNHTISVTSALFTPTNTLSPTPSLTLSPSLSPSSSPNPTTSPTPSQTLQPTGSPSQQTTASSFPIETAVITAEAVAAIIVVLAFAFKKGYITIKIVDEENPKQNVLNTVPLENGFRFCIELGKYTGVTATSMVEFAEKLKTVHVQSVTFHFQRQDFQKWFKNTVGDEELAERIGQLKAGSQAENLRKELFKTVQNRIAELQ